MLRRIQVSRKQFDRAETGVEVFGKWLQVNVSVDLGREVEYRPSRQDDPNTQYRCFLDCEVLYYRTAEDLITGNYVVIDPRVTVILYC
jgi:hypothetical protein